MQRTALVTGASRGIGFELARLLAADGHELVLVSRSPDDLEAARRKLVDQYRVSIQCFPKDLSKPGAAEELWREIDSAGLVVDILVNNAGSGVYGLFQNQELGSVSASVMLNVLALTTLAHLALPDMLARRSGRILNVASVVAYQPGGPRMAAYYASKAYVLSLSKSLSCELDGTGVTVTALCPTTTRSAFEEKSGANRSRLYRWVPEASPAEVARAGYRGMIRGARVVLPGLSAKLQAFAGELPPRRIALEINHFFLGEA